ncbi:MAG: hypothetical protein ACFFCQ_13250 [Promethearchaeota archaeon]
MTSGSPRPAILRMLALQSALAGNINTLGEIAAQYPIVAANALNRLTQFDEDLVRDPISLGKLFFRTRRYLSEEMKRLFLARLMPKLLEKAFEIHEKGLRTRTIRYVSYVPGKEWLIEQTIDNILRRGEQIPTYESIVCVERKESTRTIVLMIDKSHSVFQFMHQIILTAISLTFGVRRENYGVIIFDSIPLILKGVPEIQEANQILDVLLGIDSGGRTDLAAALEVGIKQLENSPRIEKKIGILISDLEPTAGKNPIPIAEKFSDLRIISVPPTHVLNQFYPLKKEFKALNNVQFYDLDKNTNIVDLVSKIIYD